MNNKLLAFACLMVIVGLFVYLVASFLVATFNIALWYDYYRFFTVVVYLFLVGGLIEAISSSDENKGEAQKERREQVESNVA